jgi:hypothetical protein
MEVELKQLRQEISEAHQAKRKQARRHRRLLRRCRVKNDEDLEELEAYFKDCGHLGVLPDPAERADTWKSSMPSSKAFFVNLANRNMINQAPHSAR